MKVKILSKKSKREIVYENISEIIVTPNLLFLKRKEFPMISFLNTLVKITGVKE